MTASNPTARELKPGVSVVIPVYNGEKDLPDLLECLQAQHYPPEQVEYLLVDNGSHDRSPTLLQAAEQVRHPLRLRYLSELRIQSAYAARNCGIKAAQGEILAFTDVDCRPDPQWLQHLIQPFADPNVAIVAGAVRSLPGATWLEHYAERRNFLSQTYTLHHPFRPYGQTANLAVRRSVLEQVGLFRPYLTTGGDADLCWRILPQHGSICFVEQAVVLHRHRSCLPALYEQWHRYGCSNRYLHELHGAELMPETSLRDRLHLWGRWLFKELPATIPRLVTGTATLERLLDTPLDWFCHWARWQGQQQAALSERSHLIESLIPDGAQQFVENSAANPPLSCC